MVVALSDPPVSARHFLGSVNSVTCPQLWVLRVPTGRLCCQHSALRSFFRHQVLTLVFQFVGDIALLLEARSKDVVVWPAPVFNRAIMRWPDIASPCTMPEPHKNGTVNAHSEQRTPSLFASMCKESDAHKFANSKQCHFPVVDTKDLSAWSHIPCRNVRPENCFCPCYLV